MEYEEKYRYNSDLLKRFHLFKTTLAPIVEGLILLDRLAFLCEVRF